MKKKRKKIQIQLLLLFVLLLPFSFRHIFNYENIVELEFFKESVSLSFYLFDAVFLLLLWEWIVQISGGAVIPSFLSLLKKFRVNFWKNWPFWLLVCFLAWSILYVSQHPFPALYLSARLFQGIAVFIIAGKLLAQKAEYFQKVAYVIFISGVFQAIMGLGQFLFQKSLGLVILGESKIAPDILGVAKFELAGEKFIRAYGTFPHPNLFGAFLFLSLVCGLSFLFFQQRKIPFSFNFPGKNKLKWIKISKEKLSLIHYSAGLLLIFLGILVSYSRSVWLVSFVITLLIFWKYFKQFSREYLRENLFKKTKIIFVIILVVLLGAGVYQAVSPRLCLDDCAGDQSFSLRQKYTHFALEKIDDYDYFGLGSGNFVLHMNNEKPFDLKEWEIQPVHNLYLLILVEIGLVGFLFLFFVVFSYLKRFNKISGIWNKTGFYALLGFLILGFFDHYFWTTPQGIIIFWLALALIAGSCKMEE
ncbi:MAG: O-antigen ligase family protein [Candidatus Moraniibacteriota bacterium]